MSYGCTVRFYLGVTEKYISVNNDSWQINEDASGYEERISVYIMMNNIV